MSDSDTLEEQPEPATPSALSGRHAGFSPQTHPHKIPSPMSCVQEICRDVYRGLDALSQRKSLLVPKKTIKISLNGRPDQETLDKAVNLLRNNITADSGVASVQIGDNGETLSLLIGMKKSATKLDFSFKLSQLTSAVQNIFENFEQRYVEMLEAQKSGVFYTQINALCTALGKAEIVYPSHDFQASGPSEETDVTRFSHPEQIDAHRPFWARTPQQGASRDDMEDIEEGLNALKRTFMDEKPYLCIALPLDKKGYDMDDLAIMGQLMDQAIARLGLPFDVDVEIEEDELDNGKRCAVMQVYAFPKDHEAPRLIHEHPFHDDQMRRFETAHLDAIMGDYLEQLRPVLLRVPDLVSKHRTKEDLLDRIPEEGMAEGELQHREFSVLVMDFYYSLLGGAFDLIEASRSHPNEKLAMWIDRADHNLPAEAVDVAIKIWNDIMFKLFPEEGDKPILHIIAKPNHRAEDDHPALDFEAPYCVEFPYADDGQEVANALNLIKHRLPVLLDQQLQNYTQGTHTGTKGRVH